MNRVRLLLLAVAAIGLCGLGFVSLAPNRLTSGQPLAVWQVGAAAPAVLGVCGLALLASGWRRRRGVDLLGLVSALAMVGALAWLVGRAASLRAGALGPATRVSVGAGAWLALAAAGLAAVDALQRLRAGFAARLAVLAAALAGLWLLAASGALDQVSLAREYASHRAAFAAELLRHCWLVAMSVGPALLIGIPLGLLGTRRPRLGAAAFGGLNLLQTVPSVALFGLLIGPLAALGAAVPLLARLGIQGIGPAPAIIALVLYALLPVARGTAAAVASVDPAVLEVAQGIGMGRGATLLRVVLPLAAPVAVAALRLVVVQAIGLAVIAALIGAGGLGAFVFEGVAQDATDLVLLGALPAIGLALVADLLLQALAAALDRRTA